jgi:hypothetical protein
MVTNVLEELSASVFKAEEEMGMKTALSQKMFEILPNFTEPHLIRTQC